MTEGFAEALTATLNQGAFKAGNAAIVGLAVALPPIMIDRNSAIPVAQASTAE